MKKNSFISEASNIFISYKRHPKDDSHIRKKEITSDIIKLTLLQLCRHCQKDIYRALKQSEICSFTDYTQVTHFIELIRKVFLCHSNTNNGLKIPELYSTSLFYKY